jgi:myosin-1
MRDRYWHNMAARIQRAWRNYWRYKNECATRIQRFWKNNKEGLAYAEIREYGHTILSGRKERRRYSLLSYRRFMGDYLDVGPAKSPLGETIRNACGLGNESVLFSARSQLLVSKLGRSSKPSPRYLVLVSEVLLTPVLCSLFTRRIRRFISLLPTIKMARLSLHWIERSTWVPLEQ